MFLAWQEKGEVQFLLSTPPKSTKDEDQELMAHMRKKRESFPHSMSPGLASEGWRHQQVKLLPEMALCAVLLLALCEGQDGWAMA